MAKSKIPKDEILKLEKEPKLFEQLRDFIENNKSVSKNLTIDFSNIVSIKDSSVAKLISIRKLFNRSAPEYLFTNVPKKIMEKFVLLGIEEIFNIKKAS